MPPACRPGWQSSAVPVVPGFLPGDPGGDPPGGARVQVALLEVNAPVAAGDARPVGRPPEGRPRQREIARPPPPGVDARNARPESYRAAEAVVMRKEPQDLGAGGTEVAVPGRVFGEGRGWEGCRLVGKPGGAIDQLRALVGAGPGSDRPTAEEHADGGDRADGVEGP